MMLRQSAMSTPSASELSSSESLTLLSMSLASLAIIANTFHGDGEPLIASIAIAALSFTSSYATIRWLGPSFMKAGLKGKDMSKLNQREIPEAMGWVTATIYIFALTFFLPFPFYKELVEATSGGGNRDVVKEISFVETGRFLHRFPHAKMLSYASAAWSLLIIILLGIGDDLFDIRWRHKFFIPGIASVPMLIIYFLDFGVTNVVVPTPLRPYLGSLLDLGPLYYIYMFSLAIFCPNSINILAGINGIEVSQSLVIAFLLVFNDCLYLFVPYPHPATDSHLFSLYLLLPFIGVSVALWWHNWYPARVFVGDTYCYFAGMVFVSVGILGHFSKTLLLLFIPQILNFIYSAPQLFRVIPCPRHRLPRFNARTGLMEPSVTQWQHPPKTTIAITLKIIHRLHLIHIKTDPAGTILETSNLTILNLWLVWFGPKREDRLAKEILAMQMAVGLFGLFVRHNCALWIFPSDNWGPGKVN